MITRFTTFPLFALAFLNFTTPCLAQSNTDILKKIIQTRQLAQQIKIDGNSADWKGIAQFPDKPKDARGSASTDITHAAVAPLDDAILIMIKTRRRPLKKNHLYRINLDFTDDQRADVQIALSARGTHAVWPQHLRKNPTYEYMRDTPAKFGDCIEARISYKKLAAVLPLNLAKKLIAPTHEKRAWMRIRPLVLHNNAKNATDWGPAAASFILTKHKLDLDGPQPMKPPGPPAPILLPLKGQWYISQGANGQHTHRNTWAYDLIIVNEALMPADRRITTKNAQHYCFDKPVIAAEHATVLRASDTAEDLPPHIRNRGGANYLYLRTKSNVGIALMHLKQNSITVKQGDQIKPGQTIAAIGNSGASNGPHLHIAVNHQGRHSPLLLKNIRVSLNPTKDDPWARNLKSWSPREGFFVETLPLKPKP